MAKQSANQNQTQGMTNEETAIVFGVVVLWLVFTYVLLTGSTLPF